MADSPPAEIGLSAAEHVTVAPEITAVLAALRRRIRVYVWLEGLALALLALGLTFWASLAIDWFFEPQWPIRIALLATAAAVQAIVLFELVGRRAFIPLSDSSLALLLERRYRVFRESLLTTVELAPRAVDANTRQMLAHTSREAQSQIGSVRLAEVFNPRPLRRALASAVLAAATVAAFVVHAPDAASIWTRRVLMLDTGRWPRRVRLSVEGFTNGTTKIARGADLELVARADASMPLIPQMVEVRYWTGAGPRTRSVMTRVGAARPGQDPFQEYLYTFRSLLAPVDFELRGGDDVVRGLRIEVVDSPAVVEMELECVYPKYLGRPPQRLPVTGAMQLPAGSQVTVHAKSNKDLVGVQLDTADEQPAPPEMLSVAGGDRRAFSYSLGKLAKDRILLFTLLDTDGIRSRDPVRLTLGAVADEPPRLALQLRGIGPAIVPKARLPIAGQIDDDYGVARTWFECVLGQGKPVARPIAFAPADPTSSKLQTQLDTEPLALRPGQRLAFNVKAADRCELRPQPNIGVSERWLLDVVTPEQLRAMLEARELVLRQRFETIIAEVTETRDLLGRIDFRSPAGVQPSAKPSATTPELAEPGDEAASRESSAQDRILVRVERALQNARKNSQETLGVAEAFDDIALELVNNRIDTEELIGRVRTGIAAPLHHVGEDLFPELDRRLERLRRGLASPSAESLRTASRQQVEAILLALQHVLGRMLELESFNEAVELLRSIIDQQETLNEQTRQRQKQRLRDLLKE
jgi:hypothetical protein